MSSYIQPVAAVVLSDSAPLIMTHFMWNHNCLLDHGHHEEADPASAEGGKSDQTGRAWNVL